MGPVADVESVRFVFSRDIKKLAWISPRAGTAGVSKLGLGQLLNSPNRHAL